MWLSTRIEVEAAQCARRDNWTWRSQYPRRQERRRNVYDQARAELGEDGYFVCMRRQVKESGVSDPGS
jgi:hypothetical protein